jgi:hypothetical protein
VRLVSLTIAALALSAWPAYAQDWITKEWIQYESRQDFFSAVFPAEPRMRETTWSTEYHISLPARLYSYEGPWRFPNPDPPRPR